MSFKTDAINLKGTSREVDAKGGATGEVARQRDVTWTQAAELSGQKAFSMADIQTDIQVETQIDQAIAQLLTGDFHRQWEQSKQFARRFAEWGDRSIPALLKHLKSQADPDIQWFLVRILSGFQHPSVVEALSVLLVETSSEQLQAEITKALSGFGESAITHLSRLLAATADDGQTGKEADPEFVYNQRLLAARALARIRRTKTIEPLISVATDPDPVLREIAIEALGSFHDARITPLLLAALNDEPAICLEAIRTLGRRSDLLESVDLITPLQVCLHSPHEAIACESAVALGRLGHPKAITALGEKLSEPLATSVKISIVQALGWLNVSDAIAYLAKAFSYSAPIVMPVVKQALAKSLGQTRDSSLKAIAASPLIEWLQKTVDADLAASDVDSACGEYGESVADVALTQSVLTALTRLAVPAAIDPLILMLSHPDLRIRMHVLSALRQIAPNDAQHKIQCHLHNESLSAVAKQYISETLAAW